MPMDPSKMMDMLKQAQEMQERVQRELKGKHLEGVSGGGKVKVVINGVMDVLRVSIDPSLVDRQDMPLLEDLIKVAVQKALTQAEEARAEHARSMMGSFGMPPDMMS
jgi:nucleoid-associated protein EbfC